MESEGVQFDRQGKVLPEFMMTPDELRNLYATITRVEQAVVVHAVEASARTVCVSLIAHPCDVALLAGE
jgi:hypothetical protein